MHAAEVPIAVPNICKKFKSPKTKWLLRMICFIASFTASKGKSLGKSGCAESSSSQRQMTAIACSVSKFVYIDRASEVKTKAQGGRLFIVLSQSKTGSSPPQ